MSAETRRMSIDFGKIRGTGMPVPTGHIDRPARVHILNLFFEAGPGPIVFFWRNRNFVGASWKSKSVPVNTWRSRNVTETTWSGKVTPPDGGTQEI